jgi:hypothetical protein
MKRKEIKNLAEKIARYEHTIQHTDNEKLKQQAEAEIMKLCGSVDNMEDMVAIDELVMKILEKN